MADEMNAAMDPTFVASQAEEIHARLLEAEEAIETNHEGKAALLIRDCIGDMNELTGDIEKL
jgi:hypothetical protein